MWLFPNPCISAFARGMFDRKLMAKNSNYCKGKATLCMTEDLHSSLILVISARWIGMFGIGVFEMFLQN